MKLGDTVEMNRQSPYYGDWRGTRLRVVSLRIEPSGHLWASVIEGGSQHRGNGVYDGETTDIDTDHLSVIADERK